MRTLARVLLPAAAALLCGCSLSLEQAAIAAGGVFAAGASMRPLTVEEETEVGGTVAACVINPYGVVRDDRATRYVNLIAAAVARPSTRPEVMPKVMILDCPEPNAYACPGGYLFVTAGLVKLCQDESELAGVLGHEFTHVANKDSTSKLGLKKAGGTILATGAAMVPGQAGQLCQALTPLVDAAKDGIINNRHGVGAEERADLTGAECAARVGYDGAGLARVVERMQQGAGEKTGWKEFSIYSDGTTRGQRILNMLKDKGLAGRGATNAERYRREMGRLAK